MGLFDLFSKKSAGDGAKKAPAAKEVARLARLAGEKMAQNYDRQEAIEALSRMGTIDSARALCRRFDFSMEPSITDHEEKDAACDGIAQAGMQALEPLRDYCARAESVTWPLKALRQIVSEDEFVDELLGILDQFDTEYMRNPEPKIQVISKLEDFKSEEVREAVEPFLTDVNESVRFNAVGTVFAMEDAASVTALVEAMAEEESLRVKIRIAGGITQREWDVPESHREMCEGSLPPEFAFSGGKLSRA